MSAISDITIILPTPGDILIALADVAAELRTARSRGLLMPTVCAGGCSSSRYFPWGAALMCSGCGWQPLPADQLHALLTRQLRDVSCQTERNAA